MYSSWKRSIRRNTTWSAINMSLQRNIPKFDTVSLHSKWSSLRRKYLSKIPTDVNALSCGPKPWNISGISDAISPARHPQKSSQHVRACAAGDGAICSKNRIIVPYYMEKSVLLGTKPLVDSIRHFIRDLSGVFSVCHLCECRIVQWRHYSRLLLLLNWFQYLVSI